MYPDGFARLMDISHYAPGSIKHFHNLVPRVFRLPTRGSGLSSTTPSRGKTKHPRNEVDIFSSTTILSVPSCNLRVPPWFSDQGPEKLQGQ